MAGEDIWRRALKYGKGIKKHSEEKGYEWISNL